MIAVIDGQVREDRLRLGDAPAVTLHAYSPPLDRTGTYRIGPDGELERELLSSEVELRPTAALS